MADETAAALEPLIGRWSVQADIPGVPSDVRAWTTFEWLHGHQFVLERSGVDIPEAPDGLMVITPDPDRPGEFIQHYFDSRGVVRLYRMTFYGRAWTLSRSEPDFTPLEFAQRYTGTFSEDGSTITGQWEISHDLGSTWEVDFPLTYRRES